jgi:hypothetical protein
MQTAFQSYFLLITSEGLSLTPEENSLATIAATWLFVECSVNRRPRKSLMKQAIVANEILSCFPLKEAVLTYKRGYFLHGDYFLAMDFDSAV